MSDKIRYFKEAAFKDRLLPKVEVPLLALASAPAAVETPRRSVAPPVVAPVELQEPVPSVQESLARQMDADRGKVASPPAEYTGLAGIGGEIDAMLAHLER
jgi:type IV secretion system protein VirD4